MKEYLLELKVRNNYLLEKMQQFGLKNGADLSRHCDITASQAGVMLNMKETPFNNRGVARPYIDKVITALSCDIEDIYPPAQIEKALSTNIYKGKIEAEQLKNMLQSDVSISGVIEHSETIAALDDALDSTLTPREKTVIELRVKEEKTLGEAGAIMGITGTRVRQIQAKAIRKLRDPNKTANKRLHEAYEQ